MKKWMILIGLSMMAATSWSQVSKYSNGLTIGGLYVGFVNALDAPEQMNTKMGNSCEIGVQYLLGYVVHPWENKHSFSSGMGLRWRSYRMKGRTSFVKGDQGNITFGTYPEGADINFSRLKIFSLTFPLHYSCVLGKNFKLSLGPELDVNTYGSMKTRYTTAEGDRKKLVDKKIHQQKVSVDLTANISLRGLGGLYVRYSPCKVLDTEYGPDFQTFSAGFIFFR